MVSSEMRAKAQQWNVNPLMMMIVVVMMVH
jgi:hypothetical protein